jgi:hypothetical protein
VGFDRGGTGLRTTLLSEFLRTTQKFKNLSSSVKELNSVEFREEKHCYRGGCRRRNELKGTKLE